MPQSFSFQFEFGLALMFLQPLVPNKKTGGDFPTVSSPECPPEICINKQESIPIRCVLPACKTETLDSLCSHLLLILIKSSKLKNQVVHEHPAGTSKDSDICDLSNISDMKICIVGNGNIHIFKHPAYLSKDLWQIYI